MSGNRFPVYADPPSGRWHATDEPEWNGGFWPGLLWLTAAATGEGRYAEAAQACRGPLRARTAATTILRGFMFWYGAGLGVRLGLAGEDTADAAVAGGQALAGAFVPAAGVLSPGQEDATLYEWPSPGACVDGLPGAVPLLALAAEHTGNLGLGEMAVSYASGINVLCVRPDGSVSQAATFDEAGRLTGQHSPNASSDQSTWGRAQAWAMLGLAQAAHLSDKLTPLATEVADWYLANVPADRVRLGVPSGGPGRPEGHFGHGHRRRGPGQAGSAGRRALPRRGRRDARRARRAASRAPRRPRGRLLQRPPGAGPAERAHLGRLLRPGSRARPAGNHRHDHALDRRLRICPWASRSASP